MYPQWTKHLEDPIEKEQFVNSFNGSETVLKRLDGLLDEMIAKIDRSNLTMSQYQNPNWGFETAHKNGMVAAYKAVKELVAIKDQ